MDPLAAGEPTSDEQQENNQPHLAARQDLGAHLPGALRRKIVEELRQAPDDQQHRPVAPEQMPDSEPRHVVVKKEKQANQDQEQSAENRAPLCWAVAHRCLKWSTLPLTVVRSRCGLLWRRSIRQSSLRR